MAQDSRPCKGCGATIYRTARVAPIRSYCTTDCRPQCSVDGCDRPSKAATYCEPHYQSWRKHGVVPTTPLRMRNVGQCSIEGCLQPSRKRGWCTSHYSQWRHRGEDPVLFIRKWSPKGGACVVCGETVQPGNQRRKHCSDACQVADSRHRSSRPKYAKCELCGNRINTMQRNANGRLTRSDILWCRDCNRKSPDARRLIKYGMTPDEFKQAADRGCAICHRTDRALHVDHDHNCCLDKNTCGKCVRGLLCGSCNRGIGLLGDDANIVQSAADYLMVYQ